LCKKIAGEILRLLIRGATGAFREAADSKTGDQSSAT
jgi:hypothetical protein